MALRSGLIAAISALILFAASQVFLPAPAVFGSNLFFTLATLLESVLFGIGIVFLIHIWKEKHSFKSFEILTIISIAWILLSGYPHDKMHLYSRSLEELIPIEIFFHGTLALAAVVVALYFIRTLKKK